MRWRCSRSMQLLLPRTQRTGLRWDRPRGRRRRTAASARVAASGAQSPASRPPPQTATDLGRTSGPRKRQAILFRLIKETFVQVQKYLTCFLWPSFRFSIKGTVQQNVRVHHTHHNASIVSSFQGIIMYQSLALFQATDTLHIFFIFFIKGTLGT